MERENPQSSNIYKVREDVADHSGTSTISYHKHTGTIFLWCFKDVRSVFNPYFFIHQIAIRIGELNSGNEVL